LETAPGGAVGRQQRERGQEDARGIRPDNHYRRFDGERGGEGGEVGRSRLIDICAMIKVTEIAFTCYPVTDMARAREFYEGVLGLKPTMVVGEAGGMQWTEYDIGAGTLSIGAGAPDWHPRPDGCSVGLEMEDFDAAIVHLKAAGVKFK